MSGLRLYLVTSTGPRRLRLTKGSRQKTVHDLFDDLPLGVYTSLRTFSHDRFLCLQAHIDRLEESMQLLGWSYRLNAPALRWALQQVCRHYPFPDARVRIDVLASAPAKWGLAVEGDAARVMVALAPFEPVPAHCYEIGVATTTAPRLSRPIPKAKQADFVLARRKLPESTQPTSANAHYEQLLLDAEERILEGSSSNFYAVHDGAVWTAESGVLAGVTRRIVLQLATERAIPIKGTAWPLAALGDLQEAFLSSSSRGIIPIISIHELPVGNGLPGPITRQLMAAYDTYVQEHIQPAVPAK